MELLKSLELAGALGTLVSNVRSAEIEHYTFTGRRPEVVYLGEAECATLLLPPDVRETDARLLDLKVIPVKHASYIAVGAQPLSHTRVN